MENEDENDDIHGNSKESKKKQHLYEIVDSESNITHKFGISGEKLNNNGTSKRANKQVNLLNRIFGFVKYFASVLIKDIEGRQIALSFEDKKIKEFKNKFGANPKGNIKPKK